MSFQRKVVSFEMPTATGLQKIALPFRAKAIKLWSACVAEGSAVNNFHFIGAATASDEQWVVGFNGKSGAPTSDSDRWSGDDSCIAYYSTGQVLAKKAALSLIEDDGVTFNWTVSDATAGLLINMEVIGGGDVQDAKAIKFQSATSIGSKAYTGLGMGSDLIQIASVAMPTASGLQVANHNVYSFGAGTGPTARWAVSQDDKNAQGTMRTARMFSNDEILSAIFNDADWLTADIESLDIDGFTLDFKTVQPGELDFFVLAIKGPGVHVGSDTVKTTLNLKEYGDLNVDPKLVSLVNAGIATPNIVSDHLRLGIGASDGTTDRAIALVSRDNVASSNCHRWQNNSSCHLVYSQTTEVLLSEASMDSFGDKKFTLNFGTSNGTAFYFGYIVLGDRLPAKGLEPRSLGSNGIVPRKLG